MPTAIVIGILIAGGAGHATGTAAMVAALTEAMGPVSVVAEDTAASSDDDVLRMGKQLAAGVVVAIEEHGTPTNVHLRVHIVSGDRWIDRVMTFSAGDTMVERGRTVGLTIASILLAEPRLSPPDVERSEGPTPAAREFEAASNGEGKPPLVPAVRQSPGSERYALDGAIVGTVGLLGPAAGLGGASHFELALTDVLWPRVGGGGRIGSLAGLDGKDVVAWVTVGGTWIPFPARAIGQWGWATSLDAGMLIHHLSHETAAGTSQGAVKLLPEATMTMEGRWRIARKWEAMAAIGIEIAFGSTEVWVATRRVATIPWGRGFAAIGVRFGL